MPAQPATGIVRLSADHKTLMITTQAKRGKKVVPHVTKYAVAQLNPDPMVALPAFSLTKDTGECYHVGVNQWGPFCECAHYTYRGANSETPCKHVMACIAVNLLPNFTKDSRNGRT